MAPPPGPEHMTLDFSKSIFSQQGIDEFWRKFTTQRPGKSFNILPGSSHTTVARQKPSVGCQVSKNVTDSYEKAATACRARVKKIVRDCRRMNQKYKDPDFDLEHDYIEWDLHERTEDCLVPLGEKGRTRANKIGCLTPRSVKRVEDFHESLLQRSDWLRINLSNPEEEFQKAMQTGSKALYFSQCKDQNATWLPLLEKAYAKAHGDYGSIEEGWNGEGLEDLTGGVTSEMVMTDILDKNKFWTEELMNVNKSFLFGLTQMGGIHGERKGIVEDHAYSVMEARELDGFRLVKLKNPWGKKNGAKKEWDGPWSDGSEEWTPDLMKRMDYTFGNDGVFWMAYQDVLKQFQHIDRTRLFGADWCITQQWTSADVPWSVEYSDTNFRFSLSEDGPVVLMLCQLDNRYFRGLVGQYRFRLQFELYKEGQEDYIAENRPRYFMSRSATAELDLEAGQYFVRVKITASRDKTVARPEDIVLQNCEKRPEKLRAVGRSYNLAHSKPGLEESVMNRERRLRGERHDKEKSKARKTFETRKLANKKEKVRRLRTEAKAKPKKEDNKGVDVLIKVGENMSKPQHHTADQGNQVLSHDINDRQVNISVATSDKPEGCTKTSSDPPTPNTGTTEQQPSIHQDSASAANTNTDTTTKPSYPILDTISDDDLSWSSDIDAPPEPASDDELDPSLITIGKTPPRETSTDTDKSSQKTNDTDDDEKKKQTIDDFFADPWNAVCVFGLRIYTQGAQAEIKVVRDGVEESGGGDSEGGYNHVATW
ncbi:MAG: hypothetical protein Q9182_004810 [Xanthomendoza sp. 2 TL-2023]